MPDRLEESLGRWGRDQRHRAHQPPQEFVGIVHRRHVAALTRRVLGALAACLVVGIVGWISLRPPSPVRPVPGPAGPVAYTLRADPSALPDPGEAPASPDVILRPGDARNLDHLIDRI